MHNISIMQFIHHFHQSLLLQNCHFQYCLHGNIPDGSWAYTATFQNCHLITTLLLIGVASYTATFQMEVGFYFVDEVSSLTTSSCYFHYYNLLIYFQMLWIIFYSKDASTLLKSYRSLQHLSLSIYRNWLFVDYSIQKLHIVIIFTRFPCFFIPCGSLLFIIGWYFI